MSQRINIILPDETMTMLDRGTTKGSRSAVISQANLHYFETQGRQALRQQLEAGYGANAPHALSIADEWVALEEEASMHAESPELRKKASKAKRK